MKHTVMLVGTASILLSVAATAQPSGAQFIPPGGFASDTVTALAIAHAVLNRVYGIKIIQDEEPLMTKDLGDRWLITGTLHCGGGPNVTCLGGTAEVEISKEDGRVLRMAHGR